MIKLSDFIAKYLKEKYKIESLFMISGGGAMHLNNSFGKYMKYICNNHEQAAAIAAEGAARYSGKLAVVNVTTGPGGLNTLNGVFGQWTDSVPVLYISGQVKRATAMISYPELNIRQLGDQEVDITAVVSPIVKYAKTVTEPTEIKMELEKAIHIATTGRPGPVWLNIPIDVQAAMLEESHLDGFTPKEENATQKLYLNELKKALEGAKRGVIIAGQGIRIAGVQEQFLQLIEKLQFPVVTTLCGADLLNEDSKYYIGRIGTIGQRAGNFALQNADLILSLGSRNNIRQISYNWENFAHRAYKIVVDLDSAELGKPTLKPDLAINEDLATFIPKLLETKLELAEKRAEYLEWCRVRKEKYAPAKDKMYESSEEWINPYHAVATISKLAAKDSCFVCGNASPTICAFQMADFSGERRFIQNSGCASMGYALPAAIGAATVVGDRELICITGDGSIMMNLQELQTIAGNDLNIKIFIINNSGYSSIKQTQRNFFNGELTACNAETGVKSPDFNKLATAFNIENNIIERASELEEKIGEALQSKGAFICNIKTDPEQIFVPKLSSYKMPDGTLVSKSLEDMYPFLPEEEMAENRL